MANANLPPLVTTDGPTVERPDVLSYDDLAVLLGKSSPAEKHKLFSNRLKFVLANIAMTAEDALQHHAADERQAIKKELTLSLSERISILCDFGNDVELRMGVSYYLYRPAHTVRPTHWSVGAADSVTGFPQKIDFPEAPEHDDASRHAEAVQLQNDNLPSIFLTDRLYEYAIRVPDIQTITPTFHKT